MSVRRADRIVVVGSGLPSLVTAICFAPLPVLKALRTCFLQRFLVSRAPDWAPASIRCGSRSHSGLRPITIWAGFERIIAGGSPLAGCGLLNSWRPPALHDVNRLASGLLFEMAVVGRWAAAEFQDCSCHASCRRRYEGVDTRQTIAESMATLADLVELRRRIEGR